MVDSQTLPSKHLDMDRTVLYREIVRIALDGEQEKTENTIFKADDVTKEINSISLGLCRLQASLKQMRPLYLALSGPQQMRESEKDDFDYLVRQMLQNEQRRVRALEKRESQRCEASKPTGMSRWLANTESQATADTLARHRQGMFFYLNSMLQQISMQLGELQQVRTARSISTRPHTTQVTKFHPELDVPSTQTSQQASLIDSSLPPSAPLKAYSQQIPLEHMQLLQEEHDVLLEELNANLEKAQKAEQSLREIADLQAELSQHLSSQSQQLDSLKTDAFRTTSDISRANEQLEKAKKSNRRASHFIICSSLATGVFLLLLNGR